MRIVFIGRSNFANHCFANWLAQHHEVVAYFQADMTRYTSNYRWQWLKRRAKRGGWLRAIDQMLFQLYYNAFQVRTNNLLMKQAFSQAFGRENFALPGSIPVYRFANLNSPEAVAKLEELQPDAAFAVCISQYLKQPYMEIPRYGTLLYHEGLTPEYKGLHTAFWANYNGDGHRIGYTLLRLNEKLDGGQPIAQGTGKIHPDLARYWGYAGHQALIDGLPDVARALDALEQNRSIRVQRDFGAERMYSYAGLSDEVHRIMAHRRYKQQKQQRKVGRVSST